MPKRLKTYRVDAELHAAVAAKAAERGETVTNVIVQRFRAYIRDDEAPGIVSAAPVAESTVYTEPGAPESYMEPPSGAPACKHPAASVDELGVCRECGADVW